MKAYLIILLFFIMAVSCTKKSGSEKALGETDVDSIGTFTANVSSDLVNVSTGSDDEAIEEDSETATYYILVADTSLLYYSLQKKMLALNEEYNYSIDTMGRFYNEEKDLIALPENDEDDMYAGDYFPRRFPSNELSLEYLDFYNNTAGDKTIALVAGIFETATEAGLALKTLKFNAPKAFVLEARVYTGCMH